MSQVPAVKQSDLVYYDPRFVMATPMLPTPTLFGPPGDREEPQPEQIVDSTPPETKEQRWRIPVDILQRMRRLAKLHNRSLIAEVTHALRQYLRSQGER